METFWSLLVKYLYGFLNYELLKKPIAQTFFFVFFVYLATADWTGFLWTATHLHACWIHSQTSSVWVVKKSSTHKRVNDSCFAVNSLSWSIKKNTIGHLFFLLFRFLFFLDAMYKVWLNSGLFMHTVVQSIHSLLHSFTSPYLTAPIVYSLVQSCIALRLYLLYSFSPISSFIPASLIFHLAHFYFLSCFSFLSFILSVIQWSRLS